MRRISLFATVLSGVLVAGCTHLSPAPAPITWPSADYEAAGDAAGMHVFVYGKRTVLAFDHRPLRLTVQDENGVPVPYEREGHYYRMARQLDRFTVWANLRTLSFIRTSHPTLPDAIAVPPTERKEPTRPPKQDQAASDTPVLLSAQPAPDQEVPSLAQLFAAQCDTLRHLIARNANNSETTALAARLDRIEAQRISGTATTIYVQFEVGATDVRLDQQAMHALIPAAMGAERIDIEGHTGARIEGRDDLRIALGRARATRDFLVAYGVDSSKINIAARPAGDFLAPAASEQGRAWNRRAEIQLVHRQDEH